MKRKKSEELFRDLAKKLGFHVHKWRDAGYIYCGVCKNPILKCPECGSPLFLQKTSKHLDFTVFPVPIEVECKQAERVWSLFDFTESQEEIMENPTEDMWLFLLMGSGRSKSMYLIPIDEFMKRRVASPYKSIRVGKGRVMQADDFFGEYKIIDIKEHEFWRRYGAMAVRRI